MNLKIDFRHATLQKHDLATEQTATTCGEFAGAKLLCPCSTTVCMQTHPAALRALHTFLGHIVVYAVVSDISDIKLCIAQLLQN